MKKYIKFSNLPPRFNFSSMAVWLLVSERFSAPGWIYGAIATIYVLASIITIVEICTSTAVDIFEEKK